MNIEYIDVQHDHASQKCNTLLSLIFHTAPSFFNTAWQREIMVDKIQNVAS